MIKSSIMFSAHAIHVLVRNTLIFFVVLCTALFVWLSLGVSVDKVKIAQYHMEGLYIKLDKRLTLKADKVVIPRPKASPSWESVDETFERIKYLLTFFEHIDLKQIEFENNILGIHFLDNILQISSKEYLVRGNVHREGKMLIGKIPMLQLKEHNIVVRGEFSYDLHQDRLQVEGKFLYGEIVGFFSAFKQGESIEFTLSTDGFHDLRSIIDKFAIHPSVKPWIVEHIKAKRYQLISLRAKGDITTSGFRLDLDSLKGVALFEGVSISFKQELPPVLARSMTLHYSHQKGLEFDLEHPSYLGKNLNGSAVTIGHLQDDNTTLHLHLKFDTRFDKEVQDILKAYGIEVPVLQKSGKVIASLDAQIALKEPQSHFEADVQFEEGDVEIKGVRLPVKSGRLHYEGSRIELDGIVLKDEMYEGVVDGTIDLSNKRASLLFDAKTVALSKENELLFGLKDRKIPFRLSYAKGVEIEMPQYEIALRSKEDKITLVLENLSKIAPFVSDEIPIHEGGKLTIETKDFEKFDFKGMLMRNASFIYRDTDRCETQIPVEGHFSKDNIEVYAFGRKLYYNKKKNRISLKGLHIDFKKFLQYEEKFYANSQKQKNPSKKSLVILGKQSHLRYENYRLITDSYDVEVKPNGDIQAIGSADGDIVKFIKRGKEITLQALRIKDKTLHPLINFTGLQNGRYSLTKKGNPQNVMKGEIILEGGVMKDFKAYNNTLAFINTIPALATLQNPGYSSEGFEIKSGVVEYRMIKRTKIIFDSIYIEGKSATIIGKGALDLEKKTIDIELGIQVARTLGKVVGSIPLVGYILVGKEKSLTVGLQISGSLDKPEVSISAAKDILSYPLQLIKRTFEAPAELLTPTATQTESIQEDTK